jgi:hypothetical protein
MKEPELEEEDLRAAVDDGRLSITRRSLGEQPATVEVTLPSGRALQVPLADRGDGRATAETVAEENGLYKASDGKRTAFAAAGALNSREFADLRSTDALAGPLVEATGGAIIRIADGALPQVRRVRPGRDAGGGNWIGLESNEDYVVTGVTAMPLLPVWLLLGLVLATALFGWRREGR